MSRKVAVLLLALAVPVSAQIVSYEGTSFPEEDGWIRDARIFLAERWIDGGWLVQRAEVVDPGPPEVDEDDFYRRSLAQFGGASALFFEWRMETDGPREGIPGVAPAVLAVSGRMGIAYHFTIASNQVRFIDSDLRVLYVDVEAGSAHTYRLELRADETYVWFIDGTIVDTGPAPGPYPTDDSVVVFGARAAGGPITAWWHYIRFGVIPVSGSGDYDSDGEATLDDFYFVHECLTNERPGINGGPGQDAGPGCRFADFDFDNDVDLLDIAEFQVNFTGGE